MSEFYGVDNARNSSRASVIIAENANKTETHGNHWSIAICDEVGVIYKYCWSTVSHGETSADQTCVAEAKQMAEDVEVQCQTLANVDE